MVLDVSKIKYLFIFPSNFYCENVKEGKDVLPLFFINSTKEEVLFFLMHVLHANEDDIKKLHEPSMTTDDITNYYSNMKEYIRTLLPSDHTIDDFTKKRREYIISSKLYDGSIKSLIIRVRTIIPAITTDNIYFVSKQEKNSSANSASSEYTKFNDKTIETKGVLLGAGKGGTCYRVTIQFSATSFDKDFVFKKPKRNFF